MSTQWTARWGVVLAAACGLLTAACESSGGPKAGGLTNWLKACQVDADCGELECWCGACTRPCRTAARCEDLAGGSCAPADDTGVIALCGGKEPSRSGLCMQRCDDGCPSGTSCVAGICAPLPEPFARVTVDLASRYQTLVGFGASLAYSSDSIIAHPRKNELLDAMFADSGIDMVRMRNRYEGGNPEDLDSPAEILAAAADRLGHAPTTIMTSASPPASLKANGATECAGNPDTCTLVGPPGGGFDYAGFAAHWRSSLEAYANAGIALDYVAIQNNPNWVPPESDPNEACFFLPTEGTSTVSVGGTSVEVDYPGLAEALDAVVAALDGLADAPRLVAPEVTGIHSVAEYADALDLSHVDALAHHLYGVDPGAIDTAALEALSQLGQDHERPLFQTEMQANGFDTAVLMYYAMAVEGASVYLQNDFVGTASSLGEENLALIFLQSDTFEFEAPYYAIRHYALRTDPGWVRVGASSDTRELLASAWLSPEEDALTLVLVNAGLTNVDLELALDEGRPDLFANSEVTRTTFEGIERSAGLGVLSDEGILRIPGHSIVTVAWQQ